MDKVGQKKWQTRARRWGILGLGSRGALGGRDERVDAPRRR